MDPLTNLGRNDPCWCGEPHKYKACHGRHYPPSTPGQPIENTDDEDQVWLSPTISMARDALHLPSTGVVPLVMATGRPQAWPIEVDPAIQALLDAPKLSTLPLPVLGQHRFEIFDHTEHDRAELNYGVASIGVAVAQALAELGLRPDRPTIVWNDEVDAERLLGQTLLFADHICVPDHVFAALTDGRDDDAIQDAIAGQRRLRPLIEAGIIVPVPEALGVAARVAAANAMTERDLQRRDLTDWIRRQLIVEGPTAREAMFINAIDNLGASEMWLYARHAVVDHDLDDGGSSFTFPLPGTYDATHDYEPWRQQNLDKAVGRYVQRTNERLVTGEVFTADYLTTSPFQARLLARKGVLPDRPVHAAIWADIPSLPTADPATLARVATEEEAVEDLRQKVRSALRGARDLGTGAQALTDLGEDLAQASRQLQRTVRTERRWKVIVPAAAGLGAIALGGAGGLHSIVAGALGAAGGLVPYIADRAGRRRNAAYLFYLADRSRRRRHR